MTFYLQTYPYRRMARRWAHLPWYGLSRTVPGENHEQTFGINVREDAERDLYVLSALVPGMKSDELNIQVLDDVVRIQGEYQMDESSYLVRELPSGSFTRTLRLPAPIDADHVEANITDGVLTLRLPKAESARPKQIKIRSN